LLLFIFSLNITGIFLAFKIAQQTLLVKNSSIFAQGNPDAVLFESNILELFGVKIKQYLELE